MRENSEGLSGFFGCVLMILFFGYGAAQIYAGYIGIEYHLGVGWAIAAMVVTFMFRFTLPITIGSFYCALDVWNWHWSLALLFAAPGLAFMALMLPGIFASVISGLRR